MKTVLTLLLAAALTACGCGSDDAATVVSPAADTATQTTQPTNPTPPTAIGTSDRACRDVAGNDVECK